MFFSVRFGEFKIIFDPIRPPLINTGSFFNHINLFYRLRPTQSLPNFKSVKLFRLEYTTGKARFKYSDRNQIIYGTSISCICQSTVSKPYIHTQKNMGLGIHPKPRPKKPKKIWVWVKTQIFWSKLLKKIYKKFVFLPKPIFFVFFGYGFWV